jgi:IS5 family transposase
LLATAAEAKLLRTNRIRVDTTVVPANVAYPTDSGLLAKAVRRIAAAGKRIQAAGGAVRTRVRDRSRAAGKRAHAVASKLRSRAALGREEAKAAVLASTGELAELAETAAREAERLLVNAKRAVRGATAKAAELRARGQHDAAAGRRRGRLVRAVNDLAKLLDATRQIVAQTRQRVAGVTPDGASRRVSLHDGDARPIAKGRLGKPVEFGHKAQIVDNDDGIVLDHNVEQGNPADAPQLAPAVKTGHQTRRTHAAHRHRRPRLRRSQRRPRAHRPRRKERGDPPQRQTLPRPANRGTPARVPTNNQVAHRKRRPHQHPQARLRLGSHPHRRHRRHPDLDRARRADPQPHQDQCPRRVIHSAQATLTRPLAHDSTQPLSTGPGFSGRSS